MEINIRFDELNKLIGDDLRARLRKAGFKIGEASSSASYYLLPVRLDLAGEIVITEEEDGSVTIQQMDARFKSMLAGIDATHGDVTRATVRKIMGH